MLSKTLKNDKLFNKQCKQTPPFSLLAFFHPCKRYTCVTPLISRAHVCVSKYQQCLNAKLKLFIISLTSGQRVWRGQMAETKHHCNYHHSSGPCSHAPLPVWLTHCVSAIVLFTSAQTWFGIYIVCLWVGVCLLAVCVLFCPSGTPALICSKGLILYYSMLRCQHSSPVKELEKKNPTETFLTRVSYRRNHFILLLSSFLCYSGMNASQNNHC